MMTEPAPIVMFVYNRPDHTIRSLQSLMANDLAQQSRLFIYADGPPVEAGEKLLKSISEVRQVIKTKKWCGEITYKENRDHKGLANSVIDGVTEILQQYSSVIVLEDDLVLSKGFLAFMNSSLEMYANESEVMHISGYMFPTKKELPDTFFLKGVTSTWGWGTWSRAWAGFKSDAAQLLREIEMSGAVTRFNFRNKMNYLKMLSDNVHGKNDSWGVRWYASVFLAGGYALWPGKSLVKNIGFDGSGRHSGVNSNYKDLVLTDYISVLRQNITDNKKARKAMEKFYRKLNSQRLSDRIRTRIRKMFRCL